MNVENEFDQPNESIQMNHLDLGPILVNLLNLNELAISFVVHDCGMNFDWTVFQFTHQDCLNLVKAIQNHSQIRVLHLTKFVCLFLIKLTKKLNNCSF